VGKVYNGRVVSIKDFGAFVEIAAETDGLCHVSELSDKYVDRVDDVVKMGDEIKVKVLRIDDQGRIKLTRKAAMKELGETDPDPVGAPAGGEGDEGGEHRRREGSEGNQAASVAKAAAVATAIAAPVAKVAAVDVVAAA